jgi:hypothetical protein
MKHNQISKWELTKIFYGNRTTPNAKTWLAIHQSSCFANPRGITIAAITACLNDTEYFSAKLVKY